MVRTGRAPCIEEREKKHSSFHQQKQTSKKIMLRELSESNKKNMETNSGEKRSFYMIKKCLLWPYWFISTVDTHFKSFLLCTSAHHLGVALLNSSVMMTIW